MSGRVLVTGGSGFIGSHVVPALLEAGMAVTVADLRPYPSADVRSIVGDLCAPGAPPVVDGMDAVVHLAAVTSVLGSLERPVETYRTNVEMTFALLDRCRVSGVGTFVFASTNAVVGAAASGSLDESSAVLPLTPYGATKAAGEALVSGCFPGRGVSLRLTNVYGTGMVLKDSVVARIMRSARSGGVFSVYGDGLQMRDYVYADDVAAAVVMALRSSDVSGPLVVGSGTSTSVLSLLDLARAATGTALPAEHVAPKAGEMREVAVSIDRARTLGWSPQVDLPAGLARVWEAWPAVAPVSR